MNKAIKTITISIISLIVIMLIGLKFCWLLVSSVEDMKQNAAIVNATEPLPENFLIVWDKLYPDSRNVSMTKQVWREFRTGRVGADCKCDEIGYIAWNNRNYKFNIDMDKLLSTMGGYKMYGFGMEYYSTPEKCFDFWINNDIHFRHTSGYLKNLNELSLIILGKDIEDLNESEIIELIAYRELEYRANPQTVNNKVNELKERLK